MTDDALELEQELARDLGTLGERLRDEEFTTELYRALTNRIWRKQGSAGHVSLSWRRAEEIIDGVRERAGYERLALAQSGGEGEVSGAVGSELRDRGWTHAPLNTGRHDDGH